MAAPQPAAAPRGGGNMLTAKLGPLATWVWLLIGTVVVGGIALYLRHKQGSSPGTSTGQAAPGQTAGVQQVPDIILQDYAGSNTQTVTTPAAATAPPAPPVTPPSQPAPTPAPPPPASSGSGATPTPPPAAKPPAPPKAGKAKPPKKYTIVTVGKWTATPGKNNLAPWNSTLWGIAQHYGVQGGYQELAKLNGISNPNVIHPGQKIKVPVS